MLSTMRTVALVLAGMSLVSYGDDEIWENAMWTIDFEMEDVATGFLWSGIVSYDGKPLCDDMMTDVTATVLCRHFQFGNYGIFEGFQDVGEDFGADNLVCPDEQASIDECTFDTEHNCSSHEGVRIKCAMWTIMKHEVELEENIQYELPGNMGVVLYNARPLCDDHVDRNAANALCRTMNLGKYGEFVTEHDVKTENFGADDLICPEDAQSIHDCEFLHDQENCSSGEGVFLSCHDGWKLDSHAPWGPLGVRDVNQGFVLYRGEAVCEVGDMTPLAANLLCQNMGLGTTGIWETRDVHEIYKGAFVGEDVTFGADNPSCQQGETHIDQCNFMTMAHMPCDDKSALYLSCSYDGWTMHPAVRGFGFVHGEEHDHSGFVYYNGKPLCDDYMSNREASMLCRTLHYGDYNFHSQEAALAPFYPNGDWRGTWEKRDVGTDDFGADNLYCPHNSDVQNIDDCEWDVQENCDSGDGVWLNCHKGWQLERSIWAKDDGAWAGFLTFDDKTVCKEKFDDHAADVVCRSLYGPKSSGRWQQKMNTSTMVWNQNPSFTLECPPHAHTVEECRRAEPEGACWMLDAVYLECFM